MSQAVSPLLRVEDLHCAYKTADHKELLAVSGISFDVLAGETLGLVGESGCGKSTTGKCLIRLEEPSQGKIVFNGIDLASLDATALRTVRRQLQMVFQDPVSSLNPRRRCADIVAEPLNIAKQLSKHQIKKKVREALEVVGFDPDVVWNRKAHEFSGGQCQRISLARAIVSEPQFLICDEPVSALDVSVQAQILNLMEDMKARYGLTMIFVSHDLSVIKQISDRVAVMYLGRLCEIAPTELLYREPKHPYTAALLDCVPSVDKPLSYDENESGLKGEIPSPMNPPSGCRFRTRCLKASQRCAAEQPEWQDVGAGHWVACHFPNT